MKLILCALLIISLQSMGQDIGHHTSSGVIWFVGLQKPGKAFRVEASDGSYAYKKCDTCKWVFVGDIGKVMDVLATAYKKEDDERIDASERNFEKFVLLSRAQDIIDLVGPDGKIKDRKKFIEAIRSFQAKKEQYKSRPFSIHDD